MFAIVITPDTLPTVLRSPHLTELDRAMIPNYYINKRVEWYFISGYVTSRGTPVDWTIMPAYMFEANFDYDPVKIRTDWDLIVWK